MLPVQEVANWLHNTAKNLAKPRSGGQLNPYSHLLPTNYKYEKGEALFRSLYANLLEGEGFNINFEENCAKSCKTQRRDLVLRHKRLENREIYFEFKVFTYGDFDNSGDLKGDNRIKLHRDIKEKLYKCAKRHPEDFAFMGVVVFHSLGGKYPSGRLSRSDSNFSLFLDKVELLYGVEKLTEPITLFGDDSENPLTTTTGFTLDFLLLKVGLTEFEVQDDNKSRLTSVTKAHNYYLKKIKEGKIKDRYKQKSGILAKREKQDSKEDKI